MPKPSSNVDSSEGKLLIVSGPSGSGKSTVLARLSQTPLPFEFSISATTRCPREGEIDGQDYFFVSHDDFRQSREGGKFLECKEVFGQGDWYGTLRSQVASGLEQGKWVILEIDVQGAMSLLDQLQNPTTIFIHPGSMEELERRLRNRGTETEEVIRRRLDVARGEMQHKDRYQFEVINDSTERAVEAICQIANSAPVSRLRGDS